MYFLSSNVGVLERKCNFRFRLEWAESCNAIKQKTIQIFMASPALTALTTPRPSEFCVSISRLSSSAKHQSLYRLEFVRTETILNEANAENK